MQNDSLPLLAMQNCIAAILTEVIKVVETVISLFQIKIIRLRPVSWDSSRKYIYHFQLIYLVLTDILVD